jgi:hypothetical protein
MIETLIAKVNAFFAKLYIPCGVPADKQMHLMSGFLIAVVLTPFIGAYAILVVAVIALLKEIYDYEYKSIHTPDFWDWAATTLGGVLGTAIVSLF